MNEWKAFLGRITFLPTMLIPSSMSSALELYRQIFSGDPDTFQKQVDASLPSFAQGKSGGLTVNCVVQSARIDVNLTATPGQVLKMTVPLFDHPIELRDELKRIINFLGGSSLLKDASRVALFLQFLKLKPSHVEANKALMEVIPNQYGVTITDEEGFIFQINQPHMNRDFRNIKMNFITKWSAELFQVAAIPIPPFGLSAPAGMTLAPPKPTTFIAASVVFDNNNIHSDSVRALNGKEQSALLQEALDAAVRKQQEIGLNIEGF